MQGRSLIAPDGERPRLLPDAVLFQAKGTLYAAPLLKVNKAEFLAARQKAYQHAVMTNAKQVGLALLMYCQDYDEAFPPTDSNIKEAIYPYLKNDEVFKECDRSLLAPHDTQTKSHHEHDVLLQNQIQTSLMRCEQWYPTPTRRSH